MLGPIHQESYQGVRYAIGIIDSYSRCTCHVLMRSHDQAIEKPELFIVDVSSPGTCVSDGAQEYKSRSVSQELLSTEVLSPSHSQENSKMERVWSTVQGISRCMLVTDGVQNQLWPCALVTFFYVRNRCFHSAHNSTPYEILFGERPNLSEMQPFGCRAFVLTKHRKKRNSKAQTGIFLGYSSRSKCFIVCTEDGTS